MIGVFIGNAIVTYSHDCEVECLLGQVDPCSDAQCDENADCIVHETTYRCECRLGYEGTGRRCQGLFCPPGCLWQKGYSLMPKLLSSSF